MSETIEVRIERQVAWVTLDRPQVHNAFNATMVAELTRAVTRLGQDPGLRALVLTGAGKTFSAGADLHWMRDMAAASEEENRADSLALAALMRTLNFCPKPVLARVNGAAYGGGVGLVACCDHAIGVQGTKFSLSEVKLGLVPAVISPYVVAAIGGRHARRLFTSAEVFLADTAAAIGLLHQAVAREELDEAVDHALHAWSKGGPVAVSEAKQLALRMAGHDEARARAIDEENAALIARLRVSDEGQRGMAAFLDKRAPDWVSVPAPGASHV